MKYIYLGLLALFVGVILVAGFQGQISPNRPFEFFPDMVRQPKLKAQATSAFFADEKGNQDPVPGTVTMGYEMPISKGQTTLSEQTNPQIASNEELSRETYTQGSDYFNTGKMDNYWGTGIPVPVTKQLMERGQERFNINCAVCHGVIGMGNGITTKYGLVAVANYQQDKYRQMSDGEIFNTITYGHNTMLGYGSNVMVIDRWAIIAYIRALQRSQIGTLNDLTPEQRAAFH